MTTKLLYAGTYATGASFSSLIAALPEFAGWDRLIVDVRMTELTAPQIADATRALREAAAANRLIPCLGLQWAWWADVQKDYPADDPQMLMEPEFWDWLYAETLKLASVTGSRRVMWDTEELVYVPLSRTPPPFWLSEPTVSRVAAMMHNCRERLALRGIAVDLYNLYCDPLVHAQFSAVSAALVRSASPLVTAHTSILAGLPWVRPDRAGFTPFEVLGLQAPLGPCQIVVGHCNDQSNAYVGRNGVSRAMLREIVTAATAPFWFYIGGPDVTARWVAEVAT